MLWSLLVDFNDKRYRRLLCKHKGRRQNQEEEFHCNILPSLID